MLKIDVHIHFAGDHPDCIELLDRLELKLLNVCVAHDASGEWRAQAEIFRRLVKEYPRHYAWCTTFDPPGFDDSGYVGRVIEGLEADLRAGAVACKIWKNVGMRIRKPSGSFLQVDDPLFDPIYAYLAESNVTLLMHIGEPLACWQPLTEGGAHYGYYSAHPEWYMYDKPDHPSHQEIIEARDRMLAKHPNLRAVGAHLGSLEYDVSEIAKRLDRYPNFSADTSARLHDLARQDRDVVYQFFLDYQDRILYGTDIVQRVLQSSASESIRRRTLERMERQYEIEYLYLASDDKVLIRGQEVQGLALPQEVLEKLYCANALQWYPGL